MYATQNSYRIKEHSVMYLDGSVKRCIKIYTTMNTVVDPFNHLIDINNI